MRLIIQRVKSAKVEVEGAIVGSIEQGLLVLLGIHQKDEESFVSYLIDKMIHLRIFSDEEGKMNRSLVDVKGSVLVVSQFTLYADCNSGRRPSFTESAKADLALKFYESFIESLKKVLKETSCGVQTGQFGAMMQVSLVNDGPVTILLERN